MSSSVRQLAILSCWVAGAQTWPRTHWQFSASNGTHSTAPFGLWNNYKISGSPSLRTARTLPWDRLGRGCRACAKNLIEKNSIDHRLYHQATIPATSEALFGRSALPQRNASANRLNNLIRSRQLETANGAPPTPKRCRTLPSRSGRTAQHLYPAASRQDGQGRPILSWPIVPQCSISRTRKTCHRGNWQHLGRWLGRFRRTATASS